MVNEVHQSSLTVPAVHIIKKRLKRLHVRRQYKNALVYKPHDGKYTKSHNRRSLKATFHDADIIRLVQKQMPETIELLTTEHIDLVKYSTGDYFKEHTDFINRYPHDGEQVTVIVGLVDTIAGGTRIRTGNSTRLYNESIQKGGVLVFPSRLPHSGEKVKGEKEILVFKGYCFDHRCKNKSRMVSSYCDTLEVLAIYEDMQNFDDWQYLQLDDEQYENFISEEQLPMPKLYLYQNKSLVAFYDTDTRHSECMRLRTPAPVTNMQKEQLHRLEQDNHPYSFSNSIQPYPILAKTLCRKKITDCLRQSINRQTFSETRFHYTHTKEFCNGGDDYDYDVVKEAIGVTYRYCRSIHIAMFNNEYYCYWLQRITHLELPRDVFRNLYSFLTI